MRATTVLLTLLGLACAATPAVRDRPPLRVPNLATLAPVEALGYEIYLRDQAAWQATDAALAQGLLETPSKGWITILDVNGWTVRFVGPCGPGICSYMDVQKTDPAVPPIVTKLPGEPLSPEQSTRWRARQTAAATDFRACTPKYNTVVTSAQHEGRPAWRVYLLASSEHPRDVVLTGHHRITVSGDGRTVLLEEPLSKSCVIDQPPPNVVGLMLSHSLDPEPIETHVFTSLDYRMALFLRTETGTFEIEGASIKKVDD